jgi:hypothetical protein
MRLLFVADGRSPIALNWIHYFLDQGHEVHLASTYACHPLPGLASLTVVPVAFSGLKKTVPSASQSASAAAEPGTIRSRDLTAVGTVGLRTVLRQWLGPLTLKSAARQLGELTRKLQPELVHAMRIPYEGMIAAQARPAVPLLISVWGNDFTLHANATPLMDRLTRQVLQAVTALHTDCGRDLRLAAEYGFPAERPSLVVPGNGGLRLEVFQPEEDAQAERPLKVINPRGLRAYVRNDAFFQAIPQVIAAYPQVRFLCPTMSGQPQAERWVAELGISGQVELLPRQTQAQMAALFQACQVCVSPSEHDGTPNTLLEAMACGCFPVAGDIESLREWITPGENGLLVDPSDPAALAQAILQALEQPELRRSARKRNLELVASRAEYNQVMAQVEAFYRQLLK